MPGLGLGLMEPLETRCLPEEARLAESGYARVVAERFVSWSESVQNALGTLFTLAGEESVAEVRVAGRVVFSRSRAGS